ncbi:MAG: hypothetical protein H7839_24260 [Magnetococcus sp. YQC-5]
MTKFEDVFEKQTKKCQPALVRPNLGALGAIFDDVFEYKNKKCQPA